MFDSGFLSPPYAPFDARSSSPVVPGAWPGNASTQSVESPASPLAHLDRVAVFHQRMSADLSLRAVESEFGFANGNASFEHSPPHLKLSPASVASSLVSEKTTLDEEIDQSSISENMTSSTNETITENNNDARIASESPQFSVMADYASSVDFTEESYCIYPDISTSSIMGPVETGNLDEILENSSPSKRSHSPTITLPALKPLESFPRRSVNSPQVSPPGSVISPLRSASPSSPLVPSLYLPEASHFRAPSETNYGDLFEHSFQLGDSPSPSLSNTNSLLAPSLRTDPDYFASFHAPVNYPGEPDFVSELGISGPKDCNSPRLSAPSDPWNLSPLSIGPLILPSPFNRDTLHLSPQTANALSNRVSNEESPSITASSGSPGEVWDEDILTTFPCSPTTEPPPSASPSMSPFNTTDYVPTTQAAHIVGSPLVFANPSHEMFDNAGSQEDTEDTTSAAEYAAAIVSGAWPSSSQISHLTPISSSRARSNSAAEIEEAEASSNHSQLSLPELSLGPGIEYISRGTSTRSSLSDKFRRIGGRVRRFVKRNMIKDRERALVQSSGSRELAKETREPNSVGRRNLTVLETLPTLGLSFLPLPDVGADSILPTPSLTLEVPSRKSRSPVVKLSPTEPSFRRHIASYPATTTEISSMSPRGGSVRQSPFSRTSRRQSLSALATSVTSPRPSAAHIPFETTQSLTERKPRPRSALITSCMRLSLSDFNRYPIYDTPRSAPFIGGEVDQLMPEVPIIRVSPSVDGVAREESAGIVASRSRSSSVHLTVPQNRSKTSNVGAGSDPTFVFNEEEENRFSPRGGTPEGKVKKGRRFSLNAVSNFTLKRESKPSTTRLGIENQPIPQSIVEGAGEGSKSRKGSWARRSLRIRYSLSGGFEGAR